MRKGRWLVSGLVLGAGAFAIVAYAGKASKDIITPQEARKYFSPITQKVVDNPQNPVTQQKVELGRMLYHDPRLSKSGLISCNRCQTLPAEE